MASTIVCEGVITHVPDGFPECSTGWLQQIATIPFDPGQIDPAVATALFGGGFSMVVIPWAAAWGLSKLLSLLR